MKITHLYVRGETVSHSAFIFQQLASSLPGVLSEAGLWGHSNFGSTWDILLGNTRFTLTCRAVQVSLGCRLKYSTDWHVVCVVCSFFFIDWRSSGVWIYPSLLNYSSIAKRGWNLVLGYYIQSYCEHLYTPLCLDVCIQVLENLKKNCFFSEEIIFSHLRLAVFLSTVSFD